MIKYNNHHFITINCYKALLIEDEFKSLLLQKNILHRQLL